MRIKKFLPLILLLIIYQIVYLLFPIHNYFPSIPQTLQALIENLSHPEIYLNIAASLQRILIGFLIASIIGIFSGLLLAYDERFKSIKLYIELLRPIPPIAWIPMSIIIFGLGNSSAYFIVFIGAFFPIFTNTYFGAISIPTAYKNVAISFQISKVRYFTQILFFYALPYIFNGLKIGIGMAWMSVIAAELVGSQSGLGYFIQLNRLLLRTDNIVIGMMIIGVIGYLLHKIIEFIERLIIVWS